MTFRKKDQGLTINGDLQEMVRDYLRPKYMEENYNEDCLKRKCQNCGTDKLFYPNELDQDSKDRITYWTFCHK